MAGERWTAETASDEIEARRERNARVFPNATRDEYAWNLVNEAMVRDGATIPERLDEVREVLRAVDR